MAAWYANIASTSCFFLCSAALRISIAASFAAITSARAARTWHGAGGRQSSSTRFLRALEIVSRRQGKLLPLIQERNQSVGFQPGTRNDTKDVTNGMVNDLESSPGWAQYHLRLLNRTCCSPPVHRDPPYSTNSHPVTRNRVIYLTKTYFQ